MTQWCAWLLVAALHIALYRLLIFSPVSTPVVTPEEHRARLVLVPTPRVIQPPPSPPPVAAKAPTKRERSPAPNATTEPPATAIPATNVSVAARIQGPLWDLQPHAVPTPDFAPDPLRNRRARLPGGDRGDRFKMAPSISPAKKVVAAIGQLLGGAGYTQDPCVRIQENIAGLLPDSSRWRRERLQEELHRDREHCRP
ncbi:hypothetical protein [Pseudoxanthomonas sp. UTMC 1351]|uniref:hypothetical protein n=1 Tax=Pseudoxanthomonas sp. UTMC 1351 TaxID=2695853 RepID=UPI0034CE3033